LQILEIYIIIILQIKRKIIERGTNMTKARTVARVERERERERERESYIFNK
jgi:hypothetical protein